MGPSDSDAARHRRVQRRLLTGQSLMRPRAWSDLDAQTLSLLQAMQLFLALFPLELSVYGFPAPWDDSRLADAPWPAVLAVFGGCGLVNAILLAGKLRRETPAGVALRPWLRILAFTLGSVPVLWLSTVSAWDRVRTARPRWAFTPRPTHARRSFLKSRDGSLRAIPTMGRRFSVETLKFIWLFFANAFVLILVCLRLALAGDPSSRRATLWAAIFVHVAICLVMVHHQTVEARRNSILGARRTARRLLPAVFLLPLPVSLLGLFLVLDDRLIDPRASTLTSAAYRNRQGMERLDAWSRLQRSLDRSSALRRLRQRLETAARARQPGVLGERLTRLYRLKTALLALDALALGWLLGLALAPGAIAAVLDGSLFVFLRTAAAGYLLAFGLVIARAAGRARGSAHVYGSVFAAGQLTCLAGFHTGAVLAQGRLREAGILIALACAAAAMIYVLSGMLGYLIARTPLDVGVALWPGIVLTMALVGLAIALDDRPAQALARAVLGFAFLSPLWHAAVAARFARSLLHPFDVRRLRGYPRPLRRTLGVLAATLAVPLGGLAVPYWIYVRRRHWPAYERHALSEARP